MIELSERDEQVLDYLRQYDPKRNGAPAPSYRDIVRACGLSSTALVKLSLVQLKEAGLIEWFPDVARSVRVLPEAEPSAVVSRRAEGGGGGWA